MQINTLQDFLSQLTQISQASKKTHWIMRDLHVVKLTQEIRDKSRQQKEIDLEGAAKKLRSLRKAYISKKSLKMVSLYNRAVKNFNTFTSAHQLTSLTPSLLRTLNKECLLKSAEAFVSSPTPTLNEYLVSINEKKHLELSYKNFVSLFEQFGGKILFLPVIESGKRYQPYVEVEDQEFYCVCQAGQIRSPTLKLCLQELKNRDGLDIKIRQTHGVACGYDPLSWLEKINKPHPDEGFTNCFLDAFGIMRENRFGKHTFERHNDEPEVVRKHFLENYYRVNGKDGTRQVYLTFWNTGFEVLRGMIESNVCIHAGVKDSEPDHQIFKNVTIVFIPEKDRISHFKLSESACNWIHLLMSMDSMVAPSTAENQGYDALSFEERRQLFWTIDDQCEKNSVYYNHLKLFCARYKEFQLAYPHCQPMELWKHMFQVEALRAYYWRWSGLLQPKKRQDQGDIIPKIPVGVDHSGSSIEPS